MQNREKLDKWNIKQDIDSNKIYSLPSSTLRLTFYPRVLVLRGALINL